MNTSVSYGGLSPAVIGGLGVIFGCLKKMAQSAHSNVTLQPLSRVIQFYDGGNWGDDPISGQASSRVFRVSDFLGDFQLNYVTPPHRRLEPKRLEKYRLQHGDVLVVKSSGSGTRVVSGRAAVFTPPDDGLYVASNFLLRLRPANTMVPEYLGFALGSPQVREEVAESVKTMTYPNLAVRSYLQTLIPVVSLGHQRTIAAFIRALLMGAPLPDLPDFLDDQRRLVARIERTNVAFAAVKHLVEEVTSEAEALIISMHLRLAGERRRALHEILKLDEDVVPVLPDAFYPQVGIKSFGVGLFRKPEIRGTDTTYRNFNRLYEGAVVLSQVKGWEGAVAVCPSSLSGLFVSPEYRTFRCRQGEASSEYLSTLVRMPWFWRQLSHATRGAGARRERTRPEQFLELQMPMPDFPAQSHGVSVFRRMEELRVLRRTVTPEMNALLPSILDRAFKEEL